MASQKSRKNVLLLTCSRTRSNLVFRWICTSPDVHAIRYPFVASRRYGKTENSLLYHLRHNEDFQLFGLVRAHRLLFDSFSSQGMQPIVVDSWDVVTDTPRIQTVLEERLGTQGMRHVWQPRTKEELANFHPMTLGATRVANESSGIKRPESKATSEGDGKNFFSDWQEKYGDKVAKQLQGFVDRNLPDYEYLRQFRM